MGKLEVKKLAPRDLLLETDQLGMMLKRLGRMSIDNPSFKYLKGASLTLTDGQEVDEFTAGMLLPYVLQRIPTELIAGKDERDRLSIKPVEIVLTNNHDMFVDQQTRERLKTSTARRRWYLVEEKKDTRTIYLHIRDHVETGTDLIEIISMLSALSIIRGANFSQVYQHIVGCRNFPENQGSNSVFLNKDLFEEWKQKPINVSWDFNVERGSAVDTLIGSLSEYFAKNERSEKKPYLLIGNDFSWRLTMFTLLLNDQQFQLLSNQFGHELGEVNKQLDIMNAPEDLKRFVQKYTLLTLLNKYYRHKPELISIYHDIFTKENYQRLGYTRIFFGARGSLEEDEYQRSVLAEPIDYWDPKIFDRTILCNQESYIRNLFNRLINMGQPILSVPYIVGMMSAELTTKLIEANLVDGEKVGFVGKVGNIVMGETRPLVRGQIVIPRTVNYPNAKSLIYPAQFNIKGDDEGSSLFLSAFTACDLVTVPTVTLQAFSDFEQFNSGATCVDMEQYYLVNRLKQLGLNTKIIPAFYVSDNSVMPDYRSRMKNGETLSVPLSITDGAVAVSLATLFAVNQLEITSRR